MHDWSADGLSDEQIADKLGCLNHTRMDGRSYGADEVRTVLADN